MSTQQPIDEPWPIKVIPNWGDGMWYPDDKAVEEYSPDSVVAFHPLPSCECGKDVKPGEDQCWVCLGEQFPVDIPESWYLYAQDNYQPITMAYQTLPTSVGTTSHPITYVFTAPQQWTVNSVAIQGATYNFSPGIYVVSGDTITFKVDSS